jgi:hypothetical protein
MPTSSPTISASGTTSGVCAEHSTTPGAISPGRRLGIQPDVLRHLAAQRDIDEA